MDTQTGIWFIAGILAFVLIIGAIKNRVELVVNFVLRGVLGMMSVYFLNLFLGELLPGMCVGYNPITFLTSGILGFPGIAMLYGINFYMIL